MQTTIAIVALLCTLFVTSAHALTVAETAGAATGTPAGSLSIADYIIKLEMMYQTMIKQLNELKSSNKALAETSEFVRSAARDYRAVKNFSPQSYVDRARRDIPNALGVDDIRRLKDGTPDEKAGVIASIMERRTSVCALLKKEAAALRRKADIEPDEIKKTRYLEDASVKDDDAWICEVTASADANVALAGSGTSQKQEAKINAQSAALYAALAAAAAARDKRHDAAVKRVLRDEETANGHIGDAFRAIAKERGAK